MPRPCTTCTHPKRVQIDEALTLGTPYRVIASEYELGRNAVDRHPSQVGAAVVEAAKRREEDEDAHADDLLAQARRLNRLGWEAVEAAQRAKVEPREWAALAGVLQKQLPLQAGLLERAGGVPD